MNSETLSSELQQLGLPKGKILYFFLLKTQLWNFFLTWIEHSTAMCKVYDEYQSRIEDFLRSKSLRGNLLKIFMKL